MRTHHVLTAGVTIMVVVYGVRSITQLLTALAKTLPARKPATREARSGQEPQTGADLASEEEPLEWSSARYPETVMRRARALQHQAGDLVRHVQVKLGHQRFHRMHI